MLSLRGLVAAAGIAAFLHGPAALAAPAPCGMRSGQVVVLVSTAIDPAVFVWDTRARLIDYAAGIYEAKTVVDHTALAKPGTRAVIVACESGTVKPKYATDPRDAVGVRLTSGPARGRYGWVISDDVQIVAVGRPHTNSMPK